MSGCQRKFIYKLGVANFDAFLKGTVTEASAHQRLNLAFASHSWL